MHEYADLSGRFVNKKIKAVLDLIQDCFYMKILVGSKVALQFFNQLFSPFFT